MAEVHVREESQAASRAGHKHNRVTSASRNVSRVHRGRLGKSRTRHFPKPRESDMSFNQELLTRRAKSSRHFKKQRERCGAFKRPQARVQNRIAVGLRRS
jgi:hypothetical protein